MWVNDVVSSFCNTQAFDLVLTLSGAISVFINEVVQYQEDREGSSTPSKTRLN